MILFIDTTRADQTVLALMSDEKIVRKQWPSAFNQSETFFVQLKKFLSDQEIALKDIKKLAVVAGPGHFSRVRTGVAVANALAFALHIHIVPVKAFEDLNYKKMQNKIGLTMIKPIYNKEANITSPKKP